MPDRVHVIVASLGLNAQHFATAIDRSPAGATTKWSRLFLHFLAAPHCADLLSFSVYKA